jgi:hypothetical protein
MRRSACLEPSGVFEDAVYPELKSTPRHSQGQPIVVSDDPVYQDLAHDASCEYRQPEELRTISV